MKIPHSEDVLPDESRFTGSHIASFAERVKKDNPNDYKKRFSSYLKAKVSPEAIMKQFEELKKKISKTQK